MINKLKAIRSSGSEDGFTLIELMIVVVIIGILAAIAIPIFANQQTAARKASVKSDVKNSATEASTFMVKNPTASSLEGVTIVASEGNLITASGGWDNYVIKGVNSSIEDFAICFDSTTGKLGEDECGNYVTPAPGGGSTNPTDPGTGGGGGTTTPPVVIGDGGNGENNPVAAGCDVFDQPVFNWGYPIGFSGSASSSHDGERAYYAGQTWYANGKTNTVSPACLSEWDTAYSKGQADYTKFKEAAENRYISLVTSDTREYQELNGELSSDVTYSGYSDYNGGGYDVDGASYWVSIQSSSNSMSAYNNYNCEGTTLEDMNCYGN